MSKGDLIEFQGVIVDAMGGGWYSINISDSDGDKVIRGRLSGKMRQNKVRVLSGDFVKINVSPYDMTHGIIVTRKKS